MDGREEELTQAACPYCGHPVGGHHETCPKKDWGPWLTSHPAPVPAGEVAERVWVFNRASLEELQQKRRLELYDWCTLVTHDDLTDARPRADAGEVTEEMVTALHGELLRHEPSVPWTACYSALRVALAARGGQ